MKILLLFIVLLLTPLILRSNPDNIVMIVTVKHHNTYDSKDIQFFELRRGAEAVLVSMPKQSELSMFLYNHRGDRVVLSLETVKRLEREAKDNQTSR